MNNNYLLDDEFLAKLDNYKQRELWVKVLALTLDEDPVDEITGRITGGSISIDGKSKLRRSCSINLISDRLDINNYLWCLNTKIKVSIGMTNMIDPLKYGEIVWFPQGTYILNSFNITINNNSSTVALQGKDKMCLLNGDIGGNLTAISYSFDTVEEENGENSYYKHKVPLKYIIREAVHTYANEPYHNIIINDLDDYGFELLTYRGEEPMYLIYSLKDSDITNMTINPEQEYIFNGQKYTISKLEKEPNFKFKVLNDFVSQDENSASIVMVNDQQFQIIKIEYGMTCGYRITDLIYPSDLVLQVGEGLTAMLDKLVTMLGNFEYFYNLDGQFVFQRKLVFEHCSWNTIVNNGEEQWVENSSYFNSHVYSLYDSKLISSFSNSPALNNVKNDFSIWGTHKNINGQEDAIHLRYAIDKKPTYYTNVEGTITYTTKTYEEVEADKKSGILGLAGKGYNKERARFGLSEDWWEVRDWAKAWVYNGLPVPTDNLGVYCVERVILYPEGHKPENLTDYYKTYKLYPIPQTVWDSWKVPSRYQYLPTDDIIFKPDGTFWTYHGNCTHPYQSYWLNIFEPKGQYEGGYAYFYKPQIPTDILIENGLDFKVAPTVKYETDWRELIYQMALDHNKYGNLDNENAARQLVKVYNGNSDIIITREKYNNSPGSYTNLREISLTTAIKDQNPFFYPSGYTGYEQYYVDLEGFWRQIYNPDYKGSYKIEPITRLDYEAVTEPDTLFYDAPDYEMCDANTIWYDDITYYTKNDNDIYTADTMLTELEFNQRKKSGIYYYISARIIKPVEIATLPISAEETYYRIDDYTITKKGSALTEADKKRYCKKHTEIKRMPIFKLEPFHRAYLYNIYDRGTIKPVTTGILRSDYEGSPWFYYRNKDSVQTCCTSINIADTKNRPFNCWFVDKDGTRIIAPYILKTVNDTNGTTSKTILLADGKTSNEDLELICHDIMRNPEYAALSLNEKLARLPWSLEYEVYTYEPLIKPKEEFDPQGKYYIKSDIQEFNYADDNPPYWKSDLLTNPESLIFWFDFLDTDGELATYNVKQIGNRPKAVNDKDVKAIYFRETPEVLFLEPDEWAQYATGSEAWKKPTGYAYAQMPKYLQHLFAVSTQGKSAKDVLDEYLYQYTYCTETISVTALPVYHLEPNTRVLIRDDNSHINGEYIINKLTIPLDTKGSMTINAVKAIDRLY